VSRSRAAHYAQSAMFALLGTCIAADHGWTVWWWLVASSTVLFVIANMILVASGKLEPLPGARMS
jgi:hypothetical protein